MRASAPHCPSIHSTHPRPCTIPLYPPRTPPSPNPPTKPPTPCTFLSRTHQKEERYTRLTYITEFQGPKKTGGIGGYRGILTSQERRWDTRLAPLLPPPIKPKTTIGAPLTRFATMSQEVRQDALVGGLASPKCPSSTGPLTRARTRAYLWYVRARGSMVWCWWIGGFGQAIFRPSLTSAATLAEEVHLDRVGMVAWVLKGTVIPLVIPRGGWLWGTLRGRRGGTGIGSGSGLEGGGAR